MSYDWRLIAGFHLANKLKGAAAVGEDHRLVRRRVDLNIEHRRRRRCTPVRRWHRRDSSFAYPLAVSKRVTTLLSVLLLNAVLSAFIAGAAPAQPVRSDRNDFEYN